MSGCPGRNTGRNPIRERPPRYPNRVPGAFRRDASPPPGIPSPPKAQGPRAAANVTYTIEPQEEFLPGREDLAESIMEDNGEESVWSEASAVSMAEYAEQSDEISDETPQSFGDSFYRRMPEGDSSMYRSFEPPSASTFVGQRTLSPPRRLGPRRPVNISDETPPTLGDSFYRRMPQDGSSMYRSFEPPSASTFAGQRTLSPPFRVGPRQRNISDETPPTLGDSFYRRMPDDSLSCDCGGAPPQYPRNISDETAPSFQGMSFGDSSCPPCEDETPPSPLPAFDENSCPPCEGDSTADRMERVSALAEQPSNISVYDAEILNITTAPRNGDWDIPRNRIWQNLVVTLDETEEEEEMQYLAFVEGIHKQRRTFFSR